jgi:hypothetical protein
MNSAVRWSTKEERVSGRRDETRRGRRRCALIQNVNAHALVQQPLARVAIQRGGGALQRCLTVLILAFLVGALA